MTQKFRENDSVETQMTNVLMPTFVSLGNDRDAMYADCFECFLLGDVLYDLGRDPLSDVITRDVYRSSFPAIHDLFTAPGTFEFYLDVFRKIFPADVDVTFEIPAAGQLIITILSLTLEEFYILTRTIVDDVYIYDRLVTSDTNDPIVGHGTRGIKTQSEIDALIAEISAYGIYTTVILETP